MSVYTCSVCGTVYDEEKEGTPWAELPGDWVCPVCGSDKSLFDSGEPAAAKPAASAESGGSYLGEWERASDDIEVHMKAIHRMAETGRSISEPMRAREFKPHWDDILIMGAQLAKLPLNEDVPVETETVIGPGAEVPLVLETPVYITHMSFGALSAEAKIALAKGSAGAGTATCSGEGGILAEEMLAAKKYIFEYVPNQYSVTDENLRAADAVEIKIGQSAKPGLGGHLPGNKVTAEISSIRGFPEGQDIVSPAHFADILTPGDLKKKVAWLREKTGGKPIGVKLAAGHIEADLEVALRAEPNFVTIDGRAGGTGSAPKFVKSSTSVPTVFALCRARRFLDEKGAKDVSLLATGGIRVPSDFAKALALGADAVAIGTAAMMAIGCQQYRVCNTGKCPVGITTHDPELRARFDVDKSAARLSNYLMAATRDLMDFARLTGHDSVHKLSVDDLRTVNSEISNHTPIKHV
jgi:glutamate synthase domain-containing protein 2/rubredoxin